MTNTFKASLICLMLSTLGVLSTEVWDKPLQGSLLISLAVGMLGVSFITNAIERTKRDSSGNAKSKS